MLLFTIVIIAPKRKQLVASGTWKAFNPRFFSTGLRAVSKVSSLFSQSNTFVPALLINSKAIITIGAWERIEIGLASPNFMVLPGNIGKTRNDFFPVYSISSPSGCLAYENYRDWMRKSFNSVVCLFVRRR